MTPQLDTRLKQFRFSLSRHLTPSFQPDASRSTAHQVKIFSLLLIISDVLTDQLCATAVFHDERQFHIAGHFSFSFAAEQGSTIFADVISSSHGNTPA